MSMRSDHKALLFLGAIAGLGATVRVARAVGAAVAPAKQPALERQMQAADSARRAAAGKRSDKTGREPPTRSRTRSAATGASETSQDAPTHRDYRGRLDLDAATAAEIDALPGIGPALAKRIVVDRMTHGSFRELVALRRVKGVSLKLMAQLDSLVSFSGISKPGEPSDTILPRKPSSKRR